MISINPKTFTVQTHPVALAYRTFLAKTNGVSISVFRGGPGEPPVGEPVPAPTSALMVVFFVLCVIVLILVSYTYQLLLTLVAIESPPSVRLPTSTDEEDQHGAGITTTTDSGDDSTTTSSGYITSSIRATLRHLRREGGPFSPWRGFAVYIYLCIVVGLWSIVGVILVRIVVPDIPPKYLWVQDAIAGILSAAGASRAALLWTYAKIAAPRPNSFTESYQRITWAHAYQTIPATLLACVIIQLPSLPLKAAAPNGSPGEGIPGGVPSGAPDIGAEPDFGFIGLVTFIILITFLIGVPINLTLIRIQVSVLPDDPTIIPCDKTFGVVHEDTDSSESTTPVRALTIKEAIKTLDWPLLKRAYLFCLKAILIFAVIGFQFFCLWFLVALIAS